jgi:hypothetical protein
MEFEIQTSFGPDNCSRQVTFGILKKFVKTTILLFGCLVLLIQKTNCITILFQWFKTIETLIQRKINVKDIVLMIPLLRKLTKQMILLFLFLGFLFILNEVILKIGLEGSEAWNILKLLMGVSFVLGFLPLSYIVWFSSQQNS